MKEVIFSLVCATIARTFEIDRLLTSLQRQSFQDFEVVIVDQNLDGRLAPILDRFSDLQITHLYSVPGASRARNLGLHASRGAVVSTPDDDCWYPFDLLENIIKWLRAHPECDVLYTGIKNESGHAMLPRHAPPPGLCRKDAVWDCTLAWNGFFRREVISVIGPFNEELGPGPDTIFKACEDSDFCIRPLELGFKMWFEPELTVYHPDLQQNARLRKVMYSYALASGYVSRAHDFSIAYISRRVARSIGGSFYHLGRGDGTKFYLYWLRAFGQFIGYIFGPAIAASARRRNAGHPPSQ